MKNYSNNVFMSYNQVIETGQVMRNLVQQFNQLFSTVDYTTEMLNAFSEKLEMLKQTDADKSMLDIVSLQSEIKNAKLKEIIREIKIFRNASKRLRVNENQSFQVFNQPLPLNASFSKWHTMANLIIDAFKNHAGLFISIGISQARMDAFKTKVDELVDLRNETENTKVERSITADERNELIQQVYNELCIISGYGKILFKKNPAIAQKFKFKNYKFGKKALESPPDEAPNEPNVTVNTLNS